MYEARIRAEKMDILSSLHRAMALAPLFLFPFVKQVKFTLTVGNCQVILESGYLDGDVTFFLWTLSAQLRRLGYTLTGSVPPTRKRKPGEAELGAAPPLGVWLPVPFSLLSWKLEEALRVTRVSSQLWAATDDFSHKALLFCALGTFRHHGHPSSGSPSDFSSLQGQFPSLV